MSEMSEPPQLPQSLAPPPEGIFPSFEDLLSNVQRYAKEQGYGVVKLRASNYRDGKPTRYDLVCDRGGVKYNSTAKKRNPSTRKVDCPWRAKAVCEVQLGYQWRFAVQESRHNHEARTPAQGHSGHSTSQQQSTQPSQTPQQSQGQQPSHSQAQSQPSQPSQPLQQSQAQSQAPQPPSSQPHQQTLPQHPPQPPKAQSQQQPRLQVVQSQTQPPSLSSQPQLHPIQLHQQSAPLPPPQQQQSQQQQPSQQQQSSQQAQHQHHHHHTQPMTNGMPSAPMGIDASITRGIAMKLELMSHDMAKAFSRIEAMIGTLDKRMDAVERSQLANHLPRLDHIEGRVHNQEIRLGSLESRGMGLTMDDETSLLAMEDMPPR